MYIFFSLQNTFNYGFLCLLWTVCVCFGDSLFVMDSLCLSWTVCVHHGKYMILEKKLSMRFEFVRKQCSRHSCLCGSLTLHNIWDSLLHSKLWYILPPDGSAAIMARPVHFAEVGEGNEGEVKIAFFLSKQCIGSTVHLIWTVPKGA